MWGGDANQWQPNLFRNTTQIYHFEGKPGWDLVTGMADDAIDYMTRIHQTDPSKPIFIKYAPGATHAPHHPTKEWVEKISKLKIFDEGYEKVRERIFAKFERLVPTTPGAGLGLSIARAAVVAQGGRLWVEANPGGGARFVVLLPGVLNRQDPA